ncbi:MAG: hypothetical protein RJA70_3068 [Pseudomonadota bacterium]|jgi:hypothetical protein
MTGPVQQLTDEAKFVRWFVWGGLLVVAMFSLGRLITITKYLSWTESSGIYEGVVAASSGRSAGAISCERKYLVDSRTDLPAPPTGHVPVAVTVESPCLVLLGPNPDVGQRVALSVHPSSPLGAMSSTEAFALGIYEVFALLVAGGANFVRRWMMKRGRWYRAAT